MEVKVMGICNKQVCCNVMHLYSSLLFVARDDNFNNVSINPRTKTSLQRNICHPTNLQIAVFLVRLNSIALETEGIKPHVSSFDADKFQDSDAAEKTKKRSFFSWFYFSINIGTLVAASCLICIKTYVGWGCGFGIPL